MSASVRFTDDYDFMLAKDGPAGLFTLTHEGELQFDLFRTRDWRRRFTHPDTVLESVWCHCVMLDKLTGWPMYCLITAIELVGSDDRTTTLQFDTFEAAQQELQTLKRKFYQQRTSNL